MSLGIAAATPRAFSRGDWYATAATASLFFMCGALTGAWGVHIPTTKAALGLDAGQLSVVLLAAGLGSIAALLLVGRLVDRFGAAPVALLGGVASAAALSIVPVAGSFTVLIAALGAFGFGSATLDIGANAHAIQLEQHTQQALISRLHGMFSLGGMVAALFAAALHARGAGPSVQVFVMVVVSLVVFLTARYGLLPRLPRAPEGRTTVALSVALLALGGVGFLGLFAEGVMYDWSTLFMASEAGASPALADGGYAAFSAAMAAGRFSGDALRERISSRRIVFAGALAAATGIGLAVTVGHPVTGIAGFALAGLGLANLVPIAFAAAGHASPQAPASAIALVSGIGVSGMLMGPPIVGAVVDARGLSAGVAAAAIAAIGIVFVALAVPVRVFAARHDDNLTTSEQGHLAHSRQHSS